MANAHRQAFYIIIYNNVIFFLKIFFLARQQNKRKEGTTHIYRKDRPDVYVRIVVGARTSYKT
jgi:hypothetical protein